MIMKMENNATSISKDKECDGLISKTDIGFSSRSGVSLNHTTNIGTCERADALILSLGGTPKSDVGSRRTVGKMSGSLSSGHNVNEVLLSGKKYSSLSKVGVNKKRLAKLPRSHLSPQLSKRSNQSKKRSPLTVQAFTQASSKSCSSSSVSSSSKSSSSKSSASPMSKYSRSSINDEGRYQIPHSVNIIKQGTKLIDPLICINSSDDESDDDSIHVHLRGVQTGRHDTLVNIDNSIIRRLSYNDIDDVEENISTGMTDEDLFNMQECIEVNSGHATGVNIDIDQHDTVVNIDSSISKRLSNNDIDDV